jgi:hypothetical protein
MREARIGRKLRKTEMGRKLSVNGDFWEAAAGHLMS